MVRKKEGSSFCFPHFVHQGYHGIIWQHELYEPLSYNQDRTFLHTLEGDDFLIAFAFADDGEAAEFYKKINNRQKYGECCTYHPYRNPGTRDGILTLAFNFPY